RSARLSAAAICRRSSKTRRRPGSQRDDVGSQVRVPRSNLNWSSRSAVVLTCHRAPPNVAEKLWADTGFSVSPETCRRASEALLGTGGVIPALEGHGHDRSARCRSAIVKPRTHVEKE